MVGGEAPDPPLLMLRRALSEDVRFSESGELITIDDVIREQQKDGFDGKVKDVQAKLDAAQVAAQGYRERLEKLRIGRDERHAKSLAEAAERIHNAQIKQQSHTDDVSSLREELRNARNQIDELERDIKSLEKDNDDAYAMAVEADDNRNAALEELKQAKSDLFDATQQLRSYQYGDYGFSDDTDVVNTIMRFELPEMLSTSSKQTNEDTASKLAGIFEEVFSTRIHILEDACKDCITKPELVWQGLLHVHLSVRHLLPRARYR